MLSRKGSLNLSVQAIVIVVLAMTLLGLGLGFVRNIFGDMSKLSGETFSKISDELSGRLATGDEKLIFSSVELAIERGSNSLEGVGIKNEGNAQIKYGVEFIPISCPSAVTDCSQTYIQDWFTYISGPEAYTLGAGENHVKRVDIKVPGDAKTGLYLLKAMVYEGATEPTISGSTVTCTDPCREFDSTEIFLTIT